MIGWECPVCGEANAPQNDRCVNGPHTKITTSNSTNCTCTKRPWGNEPTTVSCPIHGSNIPPQTTTHYFDVDEWYANV